VLLLKAITIKVQIAHHLSWRWHYY